MNNLPIFFFYSDWALLALRIVLGTILIRHGWPKIKNLKQNSANFSGMGFHPGFFWGTLAALLEFLGGIAIVLGFWAPLMALLSGIEMIIVVAWKLFKWNKPFAECEFELAILGVCIAVLAFGAGYYSLSTGSF